MTKKEEKAPNSNISFKLKLIKKPGAKWNREGKGLYHQLQEGYVGKYDKLSYEDLKDAFEELFYGKVKTK